MMNPSDTLLLFMGGLWGALLDIFTCYCLSHAAIKKPPSIVSDSYIERARLKKLCWRAIMVVTGALWIVILTWYVAPPFLAPYLILSSALLMVIRTDTETLHILTINTLPLIPLALLCAYTGFLPLSVQESVTGSLSGGLFLASFRTLFKAFQDKDGIGWGDIELITMIGAFLGPYGVWASLCFGSIIALMTLLFLHSIKRFSFHDPLPFGTFLAIGAAIALIVREDVIHLLF